MWINRSEAILAVTREKENSSKKSKKRLIQPLLRAVANTPVHSATEDREYVPQNDAALLKPREDAPPVARHVEKDEAKSSTAISKAKATPKADATGSLASLDDETMVFVALAAQKEGVDLSSILERVKPLKNPVDQWCLLSCHRRLEQTPDAQSVLKHKGCVRCMAVTTDECQGAPAGIPQKVVEKLRARSGFLPLIFRRRCGACVCSSHHALQTRRSPALWAVRQAQTRRLPPMARVE